jgi:hypothetical protein
MDQALSFYLESLVHWRLNFAAAASVPPFENPFAMALGAQALVRLSLGP